MSKLILVLASIGLLVGCEVSLRDGKIPADQRELAKAYLGTYRGELEGMPSTLILSMDADGTANLSISDANGNFLPECKATFGKLTSVNIDAKNKVLKAVHFQFRPLGCDIVGRSVDLDMRKPGFIKVFIAESAHFESGDSVCDELGCSITEGRTVVDSWIRGEFNR